MDINKDIEWEIFTEEEKGRLVACYQNGDVYNLACLPDVNIDTPEKEAEVEKMVLELLPFGDDDGESEVRAKLDQFWSQGEEIDTPEKEAEWQKKIDEEKAKEKAKREKEKEKLADEAAKRKAKRHSKEDKVTEVKEKEVEEVKETKKKTKENDEE